MDEKDIQFIKMLIKEKMQYYKNQKAGLKHFLKYKINIGEPEQLIKADKKAIEDLDEKIEYASNLLTRLEVLKKE